MSSLTFRLFGQLNVYYDNKPVEILLSGKAKELLCYLLTHRQRPITRESLATVLWEDCTAEHSKQYLRKALWQLQRSLCVCAQACGAILLVDAQRVMLNPDADIWLDIAEFERTWTMIQTLSREQECRPELLQQALDLYRGDLMEGRYEDWCLLERERLHNMYLVMLEKFIEYCEAHGEYQKGLHYGERILACDRAHEGAHQHLMRLLYLAGDRAGALRQYERCAAALKEELGVQPSRCTRILYQQLTEDQLPSPGTLLESDAPPGDEEHRLLHSALGRLQEVKTALDTLQSVVEDALSKLSRAMHSPV